MTRTQKAGNIMKLINYAMALAITGSLAAADMSCKDDDFKRFYHKQPKPEYTRDDPDMWSGLEEEHLPVVTFYNDREPDVYVRVNLKDPGPKHYIERIGIMDENWKDIVFQDFNMNTRVFEARFFTASLPRDKKLRVYARCNLHDLWTEPLKLP